MATKPSGIIGSDLYADTASAEYVSLKNTKFHIIAQANVTAM
jgi:hypothetical protein